jgi:predicted LPLAT superfamily acyltransferase
LTPQPGPPRDASAGWASASERGSRLALRFVVWCFRRLGDAPIRPLLAPIAAYYCLFAVAGRRASRAYLERLDRARGGAGGRPRLRDVYRHFHTFADLTLDRFSFWTGAHDDFAVVIHGREHLEKHFENRSGAFLIGAHLGSFDVLRVIAREAGMRVNVLMFSANAQRINETFQALDPNCNVRVIDVDPTSVRAAFEIRHCVERGEFLAVVGDRVLPGGRKRIAHASFLGEQAPFPQSPFLIPIVLGLPVVLTLALKTGPRTYEVFLETLADAEAVPAQNRAKALQERIETFAARLEHYCAQAPLQWFNFYDFWAEAERERD